MVVLLQNAISQNDLFAKIADSGRKIRSVKAFVLELENYLDRILKFKMRDVVKVQAKDKGFELVKVARLSATKSKLPK